ncbi:MAG: glycerate kinase [Fimbriimonadaceae bacterium]
MRILLAFDKFKGTMTAAEACRAAAEGLRRFDPNIETDFCPLSDGGEGFVDALAAATGGCEIQLEVSGPLGEPVPASVLLLGDMGVAVAESAHACGLGHVPEGRRNPGLTSTFGVGELLRHAAESGAREVWLGLGGTSTNDAGMGMLAAWGWRFLDENGVDLEPVGANLVKVAEIVEGGRPPVPVVAACDVTNPLVGPLGAARVFGPQKGATPDMVEELDEGLRSFARVAAAQLGHDLAQVPGAGAAGGLGFALLAVFGARFAPGGELAIAAAKLEERLDRVDLCLTGEGRFDAQSMMGKLPARVADRCRRRGRPCILAVGSHGMTPEEIAAVGFAGAFSLVGAQCTLDDAVERPAECLALVTETWAKSWFSRRG